MRRQKKEFQILPSFVILDSELLFAGGRVNVQVEALLFSDMAWLQIQGT